MADQHGRATEPLLPPFTRGAKAAEGGGASSLPVASSTAAATDVLSDVLRAVRLTGSVFFRLDASSPWSDEVPAASAFAHALLPGAQHVVSYHIVTQGTCWASLAGGAPVRLTAGDVFVVPHGDPYVLSSAPGLRSQMSADDVLEFFRQMGASSAPSTVSEGGGGPERLELFCGFLGCDVRPFNPVLEALPALVHLTRTAVAGDPLSHLVALALAESRQRRSGARCVLLRLSEMLFVELVRRYLDGLAEHDTGWLAGLRDPTIGHALASLHGRPADAWTLERLAREIGVSRSTLADRFSQVVGQPPMRYLARWRLQLAAGLLSDGTAKVSAVAADVGYDSEAAFSRAFKKALGVSPAAWRRQQALARGRTPQG